MLNMVAGETTRLRQNLRRWADMSGGPNLGRASSKLRPIQCTVQPVEGADPFLSLSNTTHSVTLDLRSAVHLDVVIKAQDYMH